jgi:hypothetical protein
VNRGEGPRIGALRICRLARLAEVNGQAVDVDTNVVLCAAGASVPAVSAALRCGDFYGRPEARPTMGGWEHVGVGPGVAAAKLGSLRKVARPVGAGCRLGVSEPRPAAWAALGRPGGPPGDWRWRRRHRVDAAAKQDASAAWARRLRGHRRRVDAVVNPGPGAAWTRWLSGGEQECTASQRSASRRVGVGVGVVVRRARAPQTIASRRCPRGG